MASGKNTTQPRKLSMAEAVTCFVSGLNAISPNSLRRPWSLRRAATLAS